MKPILAAAVLLNVAFGAGMALADEPVGEPPALELSERMRGFLKKEMIALANAGRGVEDAIAANDSATVAELASHMDKAFIFQDEVTTMDLRELEAVLGEDFVAQDKAFHALGRELEAAAKADDFPQQRKLFSKMLETCVMCHMAYAPEAPVLDD